MLVVMLGFIDTAIKGTAYFLHLLPKQLVVSGIAMVLSLIASRMRRPALSLLCPLGLFVLYFTASMLI